MNKKLVSVLLLCAIVISIIFTKNVISANAADRQLHSKKCYERIMIMPGDTLWSIADEYMTEEYKNKKEYIAEVKYINNMKYDDIVAGKYITVPVYTD